METLSSFDALSEAADDSFIHVHVLLVRALEGIARLGSKPISMASKRHAVLA